MNTSFRAHFPALDRQLEGRPIVYLDGPAGTQVPNAVIHAISDYYKRSNANTHGFFAASMETDAIMETTREKVASFLGADGGHTISFGPNMTTLNFSLSKAIGRTLQPGDEILITQLDHEANRGPWLSLRAEGIVVKEIRLQSDGTLDYEGFAKLINDRTRLVAMGYASNIFGTINNVALARELTNEVGAWLLLDAVHYAPHFPIDVRAVGCDFLLCSAYKFYGPHIGLLYTKTGLLDRLQPDRLRTTYQHAPFSIETGTLNHAAIAGVKAAIEFIEQIGTGTSERARLLNAMQLIHQHEIEMAKRLFYGLKNLPGVQIAGPDIGEPERAPTLAIMVDGKFPQEVCKYLAAENIYSWGGHFYAIRATEVSGIWARQGVCRLGISAYTIPTEVDQTIEAFRRLTKHQ